MAVVNPSINIANNRLNGTTYDASGNVITDAEGREFTYDAENKQIEVENSSEVVIGTYFFDGDGKRVKKVVPNGETTIFVYDAGGKLVSEYSTSILSSQDAKTQFLTNDHLGTPRINTDATGSVVSRSDYMPYGEEVVGLGGRSANEKYVADDVRQGFTGYQNDGETGLDFAQARMYANRIGRFTGVDKGAFTPADPQNWNRFIYVQNNPFKFVDSTGKDIELTGDEAQKFVDYLEKNTGLKLKYKTKNGVIKITGTTTDKSFTGKANAELASVVKKVANAAGTAKFDVSSKIVNGNDKGEAVFIDDNGTAYNSATIDKSGNKTIRPGNLNMTSINSVASQDTDFADALVGHALIEGLDMRMAAANYDLGIEGGKSAHKTGLDTERKILGQKDMRYSPSPPNPTLNTGDATSFVYTDIQFDVIIKTDGSANVKKISPPTIKRPK